MSKLVHRATYQGYSVESVSFRRSVGLEPEINFITLNLRDVKKIFIQPFQFGNWRPAGGFEWNGGLDIRTYLRNLSKFSTITTPPELPAPPQGGLNHFGRLKMESFIEGEDSPFDSITYEDIYVAESGIDELDDALAAALSHDRGTIQVPLSDIRDFYRGYSPLYCDINVRTRSGNWRKNTVKDNNKPATALEVFRFLFSQLPGSPNLLNSGKNSIYDTSLKLDVPSDILGKAKPVKEHIVKLLERYGMEPALQPDNNYIIALKGSSTIKPGRIPREIGQIVVGDRRHYQKQNTRFTNRPMLAEITGKKRIRRRTSVYVAACEDEDGRIWRLEDLLPLWGYSIEQARKQVLVSPEKQYQDVPPLQTTQTFSDVREDENGNVTTVTETTTTGLALHEKRRQILQRCAFRMYAPEWLFRSLPKPVEGKTDSGEIKEIEFDPGPVLDLDIENSPFLPITDVPMYRRELENVRDIIPMDDEDQTGDLEDFFVIDPVVYANGRGERFFTNFQAVQDYYRTKINEALTGGSPLVQPGQTKFSAFSPLFNARIQRVIKVRQREVALQDLRRVQTKLDTAFDGEIAVNRYLADRYETPPQVVQIEAELQVLIGSINQYGKIEATFLQEDMDEFAENSLQVARKLTQEIKQLDKRIEQEEAKVRKWIDILKAKKESFKDVRGLWMEANLSHGPIAPGRYQLKRDTGIIIFDEPMGHSVEPILMDGDEGTLATDGEVLVTHGHELNTNTVEDYTTVMFFDRTAINEATAKAVAAAGGLGPGGVVVFENLQQTLNQPVVVGISRSTPMKGQVDYSAEMRLYEADRGTPFNLTAVVTEASAKAAPMLQQPRAVVGFTEWWSGLRKAVLLPGVTMIQHQWPIQGDDGGDIGVARTTISINDMRPSGVLGTVKMGRRSFAVNVDLVEATNILADQ